MIGLKRGTVRVIPHQKQWKHAFEREKKKLEKSIGKSVVEIQHVGSTSVPGLSAKPIIDITVGIRRFKDVDELIKPLAKLGYSFYKKFQQQVLFAKGPDERRTHYLHVMRFRGSKWKSDLLFRDYLREHPKRVAEYAQLKRKLAQQYPKDRDKYAEGKKPFIKETIKLAGESK